MRAWPAALLLLALPLFLGAAGRLSVPEVNTATAALATAGTALLGLGLLRGRAGPGSARLWRVWDGALLAAGLLSVAAWTNWGQFHFPGFGHPSETFHYYMGAKYFPELGYTRLYRCVAVADAEAGEPGVAQRYLRDLETNSILPASQAIADPAACKEHFSPARWRSFSADVAWFRDRPSPRHWRMMQVDHGYNATPVWGWLGGALANTGPASDARILALQLLDPLLLAGAWAAVGAVFGWRPLCVALLYWGTNYPAQFGWTGGSFLRQVELVSVLLALCCLARRRAVAGGFLLGLAALFRVYPVVLFAGPALQVVVASGRARRLVLAPELRHLALGAALSVACMVPLAALGGAGLDAWRGFVANTRVHLDTPLRNHVGLRTALSHRPGVGADDLADDSLEDPYAAWKQARRETFEARRPLFYAAVAAFVGLLAAGVAQQPTWVAVVLAAGLVPVALELTSYYWALLAVFGLLSLRYPPVGVALCGLSALGWLLASRLGFYDRIFPWISVATAIFVVFATVWAWRAKPVSRPHIRPDRRGGQLLTPEPRR